jgi:saccharopine dehydrogenase-like NADP-dependent oxidoreductase
MQSVVVLGGYGNFGSRIVAALASDRENRVFVAGRDRNKAAALAGEIAGYAEPVVLDCQSQNFASQLVRLKTSLVVHAAGPFQAQSYAVPRACIEAGAHYIDLADGRAYVCGIRSLDDTAKQKGLLVVSGASSLPALSSAVVDELAAQFSSIDTIEHGITSGAKPPGSATMEGVLTYAGKPFAQWRHGEWQTVYGWQDVRRRKYPAPVGARWIASCDVPDLELFPTRYKSVRSVQFRAGVESTTSMLALWVGSWLVRCGLMRTLVAYVPRLHRTALALARFGSKSSAMHVTVHGVDHHAKSISRTWELLAGNDHGPFIPCFPAIALARKILREETSARGAMPCMGLLNVNEILAVGRGLDLRISGDGVTG